MAINKGENPYIYGFHDTGGEHLMIVDGEAKGWTLVTEAIGAEANDRGGGDYRRITDKGIGLIVRLNQSYGQNGTIPREARYPESAQRCANFVADSQGAHIWVIGNEMNFEQVQPTLSTERQYKLDQDPDLLRQLLNSNQGRMTWANMNIIRYYTINFNPAVEAELRSEASAYIKTILAVAEETRPPAGTQIPANDQQSLAIVTEEQPITNNQE